jgi:hypothetical protein
VAFFLVFCLGLSVYGFSIKDDVLSSAQRMYDDLKIFSTDLSALNIDDARHSLASIAHELGAVQGKLHFLSYLPILNDVPETLGDAGVMIDHVDAITADLALIKREGMHILLGEEKGTFITILKRIETNIEALEGTSRDLRNQLKRVEVFTDSNAITETYLQLSTEMLEAKRSLAALISLLESRTDVYVLVMLENPSEARPGGAFSGSYAVITLQKDTIIDIDVNDIYYPDYFLDEKIVPPEQLQGITGSWGVRDANWFFDFPSSARKIKEFMELSPVYRDKNITFDAVLTVNVRCIEDILDIIGGISVPEYDMVLDSENFLEEVQYEVEVGRDKKPGQNPKRVLSVIAPLMLERIGALDTSEKGRLFDAIAYRLENKDIKCYFEDGHLEQYVKHLGIGGEVYMFDRSFAGDYLAVVNTNVAGGKSDRFVDESIAMHSTLYDNGSLQNDLVVTRYHHGAHQKESWYRADNQNFIKIFTRTGSDLAMVSGNTSKTVRPLIDYETVSDHRMDADLSALEATKVYLKDLDVTRYVESDKTVYATWFTVPAGEERMLRMRYRVPKAITVEDGAVFTFIYEKQSGIESNFEYTVKAPRGYIWKESGEALYRYETHYLPARLMMRLTLQKI